MERLFLGLLGLLFIVCVVVLFICLLSPCRRRNLVNITGLTGVWKNVALLVLQIIACCYVVYQIIVEILIG